MKVNIWFLGSIIVILILWCIALPDNVKSKGDEHFESLSKISALNQTFKNPWIVKPRIHAKIGKNGEVVYYSWQSPHMNGEQGCTQVPCPDNLDDNIVCWCCCNYF